MPVRGRHPQRIGQGEDELEPLGLAAAGLPVAQRGNAHGSAAVRQAALDARQAQAPRRDGCSQGTGKRSRSGRPAVRVALGALGVRVVRARMLHQSASAPETAKAVIGLATLLR